MNEDGRTVPASSLVPVHVGEIRIGEPLHWSVYDRQGMLLLREGHVVETERQRDRLREEGLAYRDTPKKRGRVLQAPTEKEETARRQRHLPCCVGDTLKATVGNDTTEYSLTFIGEKPWKSYLVTHPERGGVLTAVREGDLVQIRGFSGKDLFQAESLVYKVCLSPYPYLHVRYPGEVLVRGLRKENRKGIRQPALVKTGSAEAACLLTDLSPSGCAISGVPHLVDPGTSLRVVFRLYLDGEPLVLDLPARVQRQKPEEGGWKLGARFEDVPLLERLALRAWLAT